MSKEDESQPLISPQTSHPAGELAQMGQQPPQPYYSPQPYYYPPHPHQPPYYPPPPSPHQQPPYYPPHSPNGTNLSFSGNSLNVQGEQATVTAMGSSISVNSKLIGPADQGDHPVLYRAELSCCTNCLLHMTPFFPCMEPFVVVSAMLERSQHFKVGPYRFRFDGTSGDYCCNVCLCNKFLTAATCCMWELCGCADKRKNEWLDMHLHYYL